MAWLFAGVDKVPQKVEDARVLEPEVSQARFGFGMWEEDQGPELAVYTLSWSRGFAGGLELGLAVPYVDSDPRQGKRNQGVGDPRLYGELLITDFIFSDLEQPVDGISLALTLFVDGIESDEELGRRDRTSDFSLNVMKDFNRFTGHASFGVAGYDDSFERPGERVQSALQMGLGMERTVEKAGTLHLEWLWQENEDANASTDKSQVGLSWRKFLAADLSIDAGFWYGLSRTAPDTQFAIGVSRRF